MGRRPRHAVQETDDVTRYLQGSFLRTMRIYADMVPECPGNPATRAADALQRGEAVEIPGFWLDTSLAGLTLRLQKGRETEVVDPDEPDVATQPMEVES